MCMARGKALDDALFFDASVCGTAFFFLWIGIVRARAGVIRRFGIWNFVLYIVDSSRDDARAATAAWHPVALGRVHFDIVVLMCV